MTPTVIDIPASLATAIPSAQQVATVLVALAVAACMFAAMGIIAGICSAIDKRTDFRAPPYRAPKLWRWRAPPFVTDVIILGLPVLLAGGVYAMAIFGLAGHH